MSCQTQIDFVTATTEKDARSTSRGLAAEESPAILQECQALVRRLYRVAIDPNDDAGATKVGRIDSPRMGQTFSAGSKSSRW